MQHRGLCSGLNIFLSQINSLIIISNGQANFDELAKSHFNSKNNFGHMLLYFGLFSSNRTKLLIAL